jgi:hypothetical protein
MRLVSALGQHNVQILRQVAELTEPDIQRLAEAGVIATRPQEVAKPASGAAWFQARGGDTRFDPEYKQHVQSHSGPVAVAPGNDD